MFMNKDVVENVDMTVLQNRVAAAICCARVDASPYGCGGGNIGEYHVGNAGQCVTCQTEAKTAIEG